MQYLYRYNEELGGSYYDPEISETFFPLAKLIATVKLRRYRVVKETPCGAWIDGYYHSDWVITCKKRFVNLKSQKKFATVTKEEALKQFIYRKSKQVSILSGQLDLVKAALELAKNGDVQDDDYVVLT